MTAVAEGATKGQAVVVAGAETAEPCGTGWLPISGAGLAIAFLTISDACLISIS
jgi:hypothetical protein